MKKLFILACALAIATSAFAGQSKAVTANYSGIVEKYDAATKILTVKRKDKQGEFVLTDTSEVLRQQGQGRRVGADRGAEGRRRVRDGRVEEDGPEGQGQRDHRDQVAVLPARARTVTVVARAGDVSSVAAAHRPAARPSRESASIGGGIGTIAPGGPVFEP